MISTIDDLTEIKFRTNSEAHVFQNCDISIINIGNNKFITRIESDFNQCHLQRPMKTSELDDDDVDFFGKNDLNPVAPSLKFSSFDHAIHYLNHYSGYHALKSETLDIPDKNENDFLEKIEGSFVVIVTKLDSNLNVTNEYYTPISENRVKIPNSISYQNEIDPALVLIETNFGLISLSRSEIKNCRKVGDNSFYFYDKSILITVSSHLTS